MKKQTKTFVFCVGHYSSFNKSSQMADQSNNTANTISFIYHTDYSDHLNQV